ncbi:hypothetical protein GCM10009016_22880 [Halomonas beimenensis]
MASVAPREGFTAPPRRPVDGLAPSDNVTALASGAERPAVASSPATGIMGADPVPFPNLKDDR